MKLIQLNAWQSQLLPFLLPFIKQEDPDILCMQEVLHSRTVGNHVPLFRQYNMVHALTEVFPEHYFSPIFSFRSFGVKVDLGNCIFSKWPIANRKTIFVHGRYITRMNERKYKKNMTNLQICTINTADGKSISVANHHGYHDFNPLGNHKSPKVMAKVANQLDKAKHPLIFCGDFNVSPQSSAIKELDMLDLRNLTVESGVKSTLSEIHYIGKKIVCDYVFVSRDIKVQSFKISDEIVSDHKSLILEFDL